MLRSTYAGSHRSWWRSHPNRSPVTLSLRQHRHNIGYRAIPFSFEVHRLSVYSLFSQTQQRRAASSSTAVARSHAAAQDDLARRALKFRYDLHDANSFAVQRYEDYIGYFPFEPKDTLQLFRQLHKGAWSDGLLARKTAKGTENLRNLLEHYYSGRLPPSPGATTVLLSICRDCEAYEAGVELWQWAAEQGSSIVALSTYGAAIDLYAAARQGLDICEEIFETATKTLTAGFTRYLVSPNAVLSNPEREILSTGVSTSLLASIAYARLQSGGWNDGYIAIDSILKLRPDRVPARVIRFVMEKRPTEEALRLFRLICLGGNKIPEVATLQLFDVLRKSQDTDLKSSGDRRHHVFTASLAQINLLHIAIATGQPFHPALANMSLMGMLVNLPAAIDVADTESTERFGALASRLKDSVLKLCALAEMPPVKPEYAMLRAASVLRNRQLFEKTLEASERGDHLLSHKHAPIYEAALRFGDEKLLHQAYLKMGSASSQRSFRKLVNDLVLQCRSVEELDACRAFYLSRYPDPSLSDGDTLLATMAKVQTTLHSRQAPIVESTNALKRQETRIIELIERLDILSDLVATSKIRNLTLSPLPSLSLHKALATAPEDWQRELYKEMHLEPLSRRESHQKKPSDREGSQLKGAANLSAEFILPTGMPYIEARFQLFSGMNEILSLAKGLELGPQKRDHKGHKRTLTERLEALQSSSSIRFDSVHAWKAHIRSVRKVEGQAHQSDVVE